MCVFYSSLLSAMELLVVSPENKNIAWNIVLTHGVEWFDGRMIQALAKVSKEYDSILLQTADWRKHYFIESDYCLEAVKKENNLEGVVWHKYGAVCGKIAIGNRPNWPLRTFGLRGGRPFQEELIMDRRCLNVTLLPDYTTWGGPSGSFHYLPHQPAAFFNEKGDFCCYLLHKGKHAHDNIQVIEFSLSADGNQEERICLGTIRRKDRYEFFDVSTLIEFPVLLKALLNSSAYLCFEKDWIYKINNQDKLQLGAYKQFDFEGAIIPDNYREYAPYWINFDVPVNGYQSFDRLPKYFRKSIVALYKEQNKKKKKGSLSCFAK